MTDFTRGVAIFSLGMGIFFLLSFIVGVPKNEPTEKFTVVDHYGTCAVVRYRPEGKAQDVYFLDCGNQHLD